MKGSAASRAIFFCQRGQCLTGTDDSIIHQFANQRLRVCRWTPDCSGVPPAQVFPAFQGSTSRQMVPATERRRSSASKGGRRMASEKKIEKMAAYATVIGLQVAILGG